ncbi:MAG: LEPR-XLL domain-containing protein [Phycisphaerae bacterium]|nr:LEPR-XLL domain-containing protein [Phycisphaerae bacterium]
MTGSYQVKCIGRLALEPLEPRVLLSGSDLVVADIWTDPGYLGALETGEVAEVYARIVNQGNDDVTGGFFVDFQVDGQSLTGGNGFFIADDLHAHGGQVVVQKGYAYHGTVPYIGVEVDLFNDVSEVIETNNIRIEDISILASDLTVSLSHEPQTNIQGRDVVFTATVQNGGDGTDDGTVGNTVRDCNLTWYIKRGSGWQEVETDRVTHDFIYPDSQDEQTFTLTVDYDLTEVKVVVDTGDEVEEGNESNNEALDHVIVDHPDLVVSDIWMVPERPYDGQEVTFYAQIDNIGSGGTTQDFDVEFTVYDVDGGEMAVLGDVKVRDDVETLVNWAPARDPGDYYEGYDLDDWYYDDEDVTLSVVNDSHSLDGPYVSIQSDREKLTSVSATDFIISGDTVSFQMRSRGALARSAGMKVGLLGPGIETYIPIHLPDSGEWKTFEINTAKAIGSGAYLTIIIPEGDSAVDVDFSDAKLLGVAPRESLVVEVASVGKGVWMASPGRHLVKVEVDPGAKIPEMPGENNTMIINATGQVSEVRIENAKVLEGAGEDVTMVFPVSLSRATPDKVRVYYSTHANSAGGGDDYEETLGVLTFGPFETAGVIEVPIYDDAAVEGDESFYVMLSGANYARIADGIARGTIEDSDSPRIDVEVAGQADDLQAFGFDTTLAGETLTETFTVRNESAVALHVSDISSVALPFSLVTNGPEPGEEVWEIAAGEVRTFEVAFTPQRAGAFQSVVVIRSDDPDLGRYELALSGRGIENPEPGDDDVTVYLDSGANALDVLGNDTGEALVNGLTIVSVNPGDHGEVTIGPESSHILYEPADGYLGDDVFTYTLIDGNGLMGTATVTVHVVDSALTVVLGDGGAKSVSFTDTDGTDVVVQMRNGTAGLRFEGNGLEQSIANGKTVITGAAIEIAGIDLGKTTLRSQMTFSTVHGDGRVVIHEIVGSQPMGKLMGAGVQIGGDGIDMEGEGYINYLKVHSVLDDASINMSGDATRGVTVIAGQLHHGVDIILASGMKSLKAISWGDGHLIAPWVGKMLVSGSALLDDDGDFGADVTLTDKTNRKVTMGAASIAGDLVDSQWDIAGKLGNLTVKGIAEHSTIRSEGDINTIQLGASVGSDFQAGLHDQSGRHASVYSDFENPQTKINSVKIRGVKNYVGKLFTDSTLSAGQFGTLQLQDVDFDSQVSGIYTLDVKGDDEIKKVRHVDTAIKEVWTWTPKTGDGVWPVLDDWIRTL